MAIDGSFNEIETAGALVPYDVGAQGSVYDEYLRRSNSIQEEPVLALSQEGRVISESALTQRQDSFETYDPDPTGVNTRAEGAKNGTNWDSSYVKELVVAGKTMTREELMQTEAGQQLLANATRARLGLKRDFFDAITDFKLTDAPYVSLFASVGGSIRDGMMVSDAIDKLNRGEQIDNETRAKLGLYMAENAEQIQGTWGAKVGDIIRAAPGFMMEFFGSGAVLGAGRKALAKSLAEQGSAKALATVGLARTTKMLADETAADAMGAVIKKFADETAEGATKAGLAAAARTAMGNAEVRKDVVKSVADVLEKSILSEEAALVTGADKWGAGIVRKVAEERAAMAVEGYLKTHAASGFIEKSTKALGRVLADGFSRGLLDVGAWGTEESTVLFTKSSSAGKALVDAFSTFFVEAPLKGGELYLANKAVTAPISAMLGGTVGTQELAIKQAALQNNDQRLMEKAHSIGMGLDLLEYISENTGHGLQSIARAGVLKFAPKLATPTARVAGEMHFTKAALKRDVAGKVVGAELEGLIEKGHGAEVGGVINRYVSKVLGNPEDVKTNVLSDKVLAVTRKLESEGVRVSNPNALMATIRDDKFVAGLSREVREKIGDDVGKYVKTALREAYEAKADGLKLKGMLNYYMADYMARKGIGPQTASKIFERMGYNGIFGEMFEERYSDVMSALWGLNADKDQGIRARLEKAWDGMFPGWDQLTAEAVGFAVPMIAKAGFQRALRTIGGGNEYTRFADDAALYLDGTRHGAVGQWRYGDVLVGHARSVKAEQRKIEDATNRRNELLNQKPEGADEQWVAENIAPLDAEIAKATKAIERLDSYHSKYLSSLTSEQRTGYSHLVSYAPLSTEDAELPDEEFNRKLAATEADAGRSASAARLLVSHSGKMAQTLYRLENRAVNEDARAFRRAAHWVVKVAGAVVTGDPSLFSANPAQWTGTDRGLPEGMQLALKNGYGKVFASELEADRNARIANAVYGDVGTTYQADIEAAHARALEKFQPVAERIMAASLAAHQARMFSDQELTDAAIAEVARGKGLMLDERTREFVSTDGKRQSVEEFHTANAKEIRKLRNRAASTLFDTLSSGSLQTGRIVFNRTRDDANPVVDVIDVPKDLPTEEQAVVSMILRRLPGMAGVLQAQELSADKSLDDQVSGPATRQEWLDAVVNSVIPTGVLDAQSMKTALDNAMTVDAVLLENIARDLNFRYDGTEADLTRRNRAIVELAVLSKAIGDPNVRTYSREGAMVENDPAASEWTDYVSARRRADGMWTYMDASGRSQVATTVEELDAKMAEQGRWSPITPKVVFTPAQIFQSSDAMTMLSALGMKRQYRAALDRECDDVNYKDPLFREGTDTYNDPEKADAKRAEEKALSDLYEKNSRQTNPQLYLAPGESAQDKAAMARAEDRMKRCQDAYYQRNDEKRGYAVIADNLLRRSGVSVPYADTGLSVGMANADLRGKYSISVNHFRARHQSGNVYVPINHGIAQNYKAALLGATVLDAYFRNRRIIADVFDSGLRGFMDDVNRVASEAQNAATDKMLAANIADFRAATVDHLKGQVRKPSPMTFSLLVRAFALYQTEHTGNLKSVLGDYAPALKAIAPAVRNLPSFQVFMAVADRVFGGSGFNPTAIKVRGGVDGTTGIARIYGLFAPEETPTLRSAIEASRPGGLSAEEFIARVSEQDVSAVKAGLKASAKPKAKPAADVDTTPRSTPDQMREAQERLAARRTQLAAERDSPVSDMQAVQEAVANGVVEAASEADVNALVTAVAGEGSAPMDAAPVTPDVARVAAEARLAEVEEQEKLVRADIVGGNATDAQQDELNALGDEAERLHAVLDAPAEDISALETAEADETFGALTVEERGEDEDPELREVETDDYYFVAGDAVTTPDTAAETTHEGEQRTFQIKDRAELTMSEVKSLCPVLAKMFHALNNIDPTADELADFLRRLAPGLRQKDVDLFTSTYSAMDAKMRQDEFEDLWTWDSDDDEEGALPDGVEDGGRKAVMALQTKALNNFLALAQLVNPHTGRQFQGFMEDLRNTVARSLTVHGDTTSGALQFVSDLVNPRARNVLSPAMRDAYFAETLARFVTAENDIASHIRDLMGSTSASKPVNRKAAMLLAYLAAMPPNVRRQMTQLVSSSAPSTPVNVITSFHSDDGLESIGKRASHVTFTISRRKGNASRLSSNAVAATFREMTGLKADEIRKRADEILSDAKDMANAGEFAANMRFAVRGNGASLFGSMARLFEKHFGADSTIVSVFASHPAAAYVAESRQAGAVRAALVAEPGKVPAMVDTIVGGLQLMADLAGAKEATFENADLAAALSFTMGDPRKSSLGWKTNTASRTDQLAFVFRAYEEMMPQTVMTAHVDPDRTNQPASSVAITMRGIEPAVQVFMDRRGEKGFRQVCERFFPQFAKADDATKEKVLGICRQSMCWPTAKRDSIVAKSLSKSAYSYETYLACQSSFNLAREMADVKTDDDRKKLESKYGVRAVAAFKADNTFYVPVYSGDHSSAILISVPLLSQFTGSYEDAAREVSSWVGLDLLGVDAKRSATTSLEAPGVGFIGLRHEKDGSVSVNDDGTPVTGECRINIVWNQNGGKNDSMLGTTLATGYGVEQLKLCAKDPKASTLKFHAMNTSNTGSYGPALSLIKSLNVAMGQESQTGEFGKWSASRVLMDFIRKQRSSDFADSTSILTDFDSVKLSLANSKMMGVKDKDGKPEALMEWFFRNLNERINAEAQSGKLKDSYSGEELDKLFATEDNPEGLIDWIDLTDETTGEKRSGKRKLSSILDGVRLDAIEGLSGRTYSLSYVDNDMMGFQVANVSHRASTKEKGGTHYGKSPRNYMVDAFTMARVQASWNADVAFEMAHPRPTKAKGESDADFNQRMADWAKQYGPVFTDVESTARGLQDLVARWGEIAVAMASDPRTVQALKHDSEDAVNAAQRGEPDDGMFMKDIMAKAVSTYLKKSLNLPMKGIDAPLVSNMSWVENGEVKTHSTSQMFKDTLRGSRTIPASERRFMRAHRRMAICNLNNTDASFRYGMYLDEEALEREFGNDPQLQFEKLDGTTPSQKVIAALDVIFTRLRDLEEKLATATNAEAESIVPQTISLRLKIAKCFLDHHGRTMDQHKRRFNVKAGGNVSERTTDWYLEVSYEDLFTGLVKDANGKPTFDRSAVYEDMTDSKGVKRLYLGGTMVGLPRTPSYNGSMWLQTVRAGLPVTEAESGAEGDWKAGYDAMVAPDPYTLKILGCDHDGDKTKLYMLEAPSITASARGAGAKVRDAKRFLDLNAGIDVLAEQREEYVGKDPVTKKTRFRKHELQLKPEAQMQANNSFVQALFDMSRALPVMDNTDGSSPFYTGERVSDTKNHGAVARGTKAALTAALKELAGEDNAEAFAWDTAITKNEDVIGPKLLDPAKGKTVGDPLTAATVGDGAQNAANARALVVSLASSMHLAWASGLFRNKLFRGIGTGAEEARNWLDFMYHLDGFSNMTFDDIKEQVCSRLGVTAGMMDTIIVDMVNYGRRIGHLPRTDEEFIAAFKEYASDVRKGGARASMLAATNKSDYAMQARIRKTFTDSAEKEVTRGAILKYFGCTWDSKSKSYMVTNQGAAGAWLVDAIRSAGAEGYAKAYNVPMNVAMGKAESLIYSIMRMRTDFSDISGYVMYVLESHRGDQKTLGDMIAWNDTKWDLTEAKRFAHSVNYLTVDPVALNASYEAETRAVAFDRMVSPYDEVKDDTKLPVAREHIKRLHRMNASVFRAYNMILAKTIHGYGKAAVDSYESDVTWFAQEYTDTTEGARLAAKLIAAQRLDGRDGMAVEAASEMTGMSFAALRATRSLPNSRINSNNILRTLWAIGKGSGDAVRGKRSRNRVLDMKRGIEDLFELMYRLVGSSTARSSLPIFSYFSERSDGGAFGYDYETYYGDLEMSANQADVGNGEKASVGGQMRRITLAFQGVTESQITEVRELYNRVVAGGELDEGGKLGKRVNAFGGKETDYGFTISEKNLDALLASEDYKSYCARFGEAKKEIAALVAEARSILKALEPILGKEPAISPSVLFGQLLPAYAALTTRLDRVPDSRSASIVTAMGDTYARWADGLASLRRNRPKLMRMATAINFAPAMMEMEAVRGKPGKRFSAAEIDAILAKEVAKLRKSDAEAMFNEEMDSEKENGKLPNSIFDTEAGRDLRKALVRGDYALANPAGRYVIDPFGNNGVYGDILKAFGDVAEHVAQTEADDDIVVPPMSETVKAEDEKPSSEPEDAYVKDLAIRMNALVRNWADARVEYKGGTEFFIHAKLRGSAARVKNPNGVETVIRVNVRDSFYTDEELKKILTEDAWLVSNANRRSDVEGKRISAKQVKAELDAMTDAERLAYIKRWVPAGVTHQEPDGQWAVDARQLGVLCGEDVLTKEIELKRQGKHPNVVYHEYFHAVMSMFREVGVFSDEDVTHLKNRYGEDPFHDKWFDEERAAEDFRRFVETGYAKDDVTKGIFQRLFDFIKALYEALVTTGVRSEDYANEMKDSPLAAMVLTGTAELSHTAEDEMQPADFADLAALDAAMAEEADGEVVPEPPDTLFDLPEAKEAKQYLAKRFALACSNYISGLHKEAADYQKEAPTMTEDNYWSPVFNPFALDPERNLSIGEFSTYGDKVIIEASTKLDRNGIAWKPGDSISSFPKELFKRYGIDLYGALLFSREGLMLHNDDPHTFEYFQASHLDQVDLAYHFADFIADYENLMGQYRKYESALIEGGMDPKEATATAKRQLALSGKALAKEYNRTYGDNDGTLFYNALRKFLVKYGTMNTNVESDRLFDCAAPTAEEQVEDALDVVDPTRMRAVYSPADTLARAVGMAIRNRMERLGLDEEAREVLSTVSSARASELRGLERAAALDAVRQVAAQHGIDPNSLKGKELENLVFSAVIELNSAIRGGSRAGGPIRFHYGQGQKPGSVETHDPFRATSSSLAGAIMAACGTTPAAIGMSVKRDIAEMRRNYAGSSFEDVLNRFDAAMDMLVSADPSKLCEDPNFREDTLGKLLHSLETGLIGGAVQVDGTRENYRLAKLGTSVSPDFDGNRAIYGNHVDEEGNGNPDFQRIAHRTIDSIYTVLAGMKFYRSLGFEPGSAEDEILADIPAPNTPDQTAAYLGIEARQLLERGAEALDFYDQPMFVANNMESWLESTVRSTFGRVDFGEFMRGMNNRHSGYMRRLVNEENWNASLMGVDVLPGQALTAVEEVQGQFAMESGNIVRKDGKTYWRFVRYDTSTPMHGRRAAKDDAGNVVSFTEDETRMVDLVLKADKVFATGGRKIVTGVDRICFTLDDAAHTDAAYYSRENVRKRFESGEEYSEFDLALYRLDLQMPSFVVDGPTGLRTRFIETAIAALRGATGSATEVTDRVLRRLDEAGILVAHETYDRESDRKVLDHGVLVLDVDEVERMFKSSSAKEKLLSAGRKEKWLEREERIRPLMNLYREVSAYVRQNPWLTDGDGAFFNNFNTPLPFVQGSGVFMYNANRTSRSVPSRAPGEKMSEAEARFVAVMDALETQREPKTVTESSDDQMRLLAAVYGVEDVGPAKMREMIVGGQFASGAPRARRTGLVLRSDATLAEVSEAIYRRLVESTWRKNGDPVVDRLGGKTVVQRMIETYEDRKERDMAISGGLGTTDEMMYRTKGVLPANAQLGHAIHNAMEGITNALAFRGTLINMLTAPDAEGHPIMYADPNLLAADASGVPDAVWATIARWWAEVNHIAYDETKSGIQNAHEVYKKLHDEFTLKKTINGKRFGELTGKDIDAKSVTGVMAQSDDRDAKLNKLGGGYALGYAKHLLQASRNFGSAAQRAVIHRALSYSKSLSVSFSMFFPLATKWESPIGAVGAMATLGSNISPEWMRKNAKLASTIQKMFSGDGWITQDFLGFRDIIRMMDSNDPFLSEMVGWASNLGVSLSDSRINPLEPQRAILQRDIRNLVEMTRDKFGAKTAARVDSVMRTLLLNSGEKAFTYALNATKLATVAQIYMELRHQAEKRGRAFDPVRDLKRYAGYINAEIGGIDPLKYAWAHPMNRGIMNMLMFSWEWTRGAWEAGGGGAIEDMVFGGHSMTAEERKYIVGRWVRMFSAVMIGVPMLFQLAIKGVAIAMGHDDDTEKWWTFQNEDKACWTAFDLTPLMRAMTEKFPTVAQWKKDHPVLGALLPMYTGSDRGNRAHGSFFNGRHYYMHFGKQGWEFFRWFSDTTGQFFSKLSMPTQRILEGVFGRSLSWMDRELPWNDMGVAERWLAPSLDSATANLVKAFLPFTLSGLTDRGDAGILSVFGPIQMGAADSTIKDQMAKVLKAYAFDDRNGYAIATAPHGTKSGKFRVNVLNRDRTLNHLARIAQINGASVKESLQLIDRSLATMTASIYGELLEALPQKPGGDYDVRKVSKLARAINRLQREREKVLDVVEKKLEAKRMKLDPALRREWDGILKRAMEDGYELPVRKTDY